MTTNNTVVIIPCYGIRMLILVIAECDAWTKRQGSRWCRQQWWSCIVKTKSVTQRGKEEGRKMMSTTPLSLSFPSTCRAPRRGGRLEKDLEQDRDYNNKATLCWHKKTKHQTGNVSIKNTKVKSRQGAEQDQRQLTQHCFLLGNTGKVWSNGKIHRGYISCQLCVKYVAIWKRARAL